MISIQVQIDCIFVVTKKTITLCTRRLPHLPSLRPDLIVWVRVYENVLLEQAFQINQVVQFYSFERLEDLIGQKGGTIRFESVFGALSQISEGAPIAERQATEETQIVLV